METNLVGLAFSAGLVAALNPCGFAMLPGYLALVVQRDGRPARAVGRALAATAAMTAGVVAVFAGFGALAVSVASTIQRYLPYVTVFIGVLLLVLGLWLLAGRHVGVPMSAGARWAPTARLGSMLGYGAGFALASLSCTVGPFLAVTAGAARADTLFDAVGVYLAYAAGFGLIVGALAVSVAVASSTMLDRLRRTLPYVNRIGGVLLVVVGAYVTYYGVYEIRLFGGGVGAADPVITAAGRLQATLAGWVHQHGALPWLVVLIAGAGLAAVLTATTVRYRRRSGRRP
ncbi:cytochrome c biogenesis protein CcdA [Mycolicibacterium sp. 120266]|uniref:cytochrome c biogenesis CcdA family protein n=1 Tax=Mycolicibacterium sp. 120266 TaxID=3090601 RepID=UPI00299E5967|nr:cytochrome c biogenesis protein CcdA [Mycolicibacterium sp. 120266]MDX1872366.1 cytochrome c biogenesis protein CcdA [Mycolicibacterium sp. 120266]